MIILSKLVPESIVNELGCGIIKAGKATNINNETAYHPDMLFYKCLDNTVIYAKQDGFVRNLDTFKNEVILEDKYPNDCILNCFRTDRMLVCGKNTYSDVISDAKGLEVCYVKQGYAACSTVRLYGENYITSDIGIYNILKARCYNVLKVTNDGIKLNGYNCGFIGGTVLFTDKNSVAFSGKISKHKDYARIKSFCTNIGINIIELSSDELYDYGGYLDV